jgi:hypothetical protein
MKIAILLFVFGISSLTNAIVIICDFKNVETGFFIPLGTFCTCNFPNITGTCMVSEVKGNHISAKNDSDVESVDIYRQPFKEIPKGIENFFPNLKVFQIRNTGLLSVSSRDLLPFPKLIYFDVWNNKISTINGNLFENNPKLICISFELNEVQNVEHDLLTGLNDLQVVSLRLNSCINEWARNQTEIQEFIRQLSISCPPLVTVPDPTTTLHQSTTPRTSTMISTTPIYEYSCSVNCIDSNIMAKLNAREKRIAQIERFLDIRNK